MKNILSLISFLILTNGLFAQDHRMSETEKQNMPAYLQSVIQNNSSLRISPPTGNIRASAEWEEIDALIITWTSYTTILREIVRAAQNDAKVYIVCTDSNNVITNLNAGGVSLNNVHFLVAPFNSIWVRDYGPWNIYRNDVDSLALIDWIYNRPRAKDDTVPAAIQRYTGLPMFSTTTSPDDLIHTGGNFMTDGFGTGFSSELIIEENPTKSIAQIDSIMKRYMGINRYIKMNVLPYDDIHHIDMHMKLLDEETLLIGQYPNGISDGPQIEANLQFVLNNFNSTFGTPYKIIRIPMPPDGTGIYPNQGGDYRTYTNCVFVNKTVIVPFYAQQYDTTAARILQESLPGYNIVGINCNQIIPALGAIHCITKEVAANDPLLISHQPLRDTYVTTGTYNVSAFIKHKSGIQSAYILYKTDLNAAYDSVAMTSLSSQIDIWAGAIPAQPAGSTVYYYIKAEAASGKTAVRPMSAPTGYWKFNVLLNTGIEKETSLSGRVYPNPSHGITCIEVSNENSAAVNVKVLDLTGKTVADLESTTFSGTKNFFIDTNYFPAGVYLIEINSAKGALRKKLVVK